MRLGYYAGASTAAAVGCLLKAFHERPNFYSATVYLSQSNACLLILTNLLLVLACSFVYGLQRLLYGPLRPIEVEQLSEKAWYAVLDTLLAMPSFSHDVGGWLLAMFTVLLASKVWVWIGEGKVDVLEQQQVPSNARLFHARLTTSLLVSVAFDVWMLEYCIGTVLADPRPGMMVIFTFEFAVLSIQSIFTFARYLLSVLQIRIERLQIKKAVEERKDEIRAERAAARQNQTVDGTQSTPASPPSEDPIEVDENEVDVPGWEEKRRYLFALEVFTDFIKLLIYIVFFAVSITFNGLPMHIFRDVWLTFASFSKRVTGYVAYRKATSDMNTRYPDATTEEIRDDACIVCRESMVAWEPTPAVGGNQPSVQPAAEQPPQAGEAVAAGRKKDEGLRAKKLPCGHILHLRCLKAWLERQQVCPTCRKPVIAPRERRSTEQGQAGGVPGAQGAGANAAAQHGQQGGQPAQPQQGRARVLNLGPLRIGFLNGPGEQIGNLVRQMQNQRPAGGDQAAQQGGDQQGPNHLGLQVPYLPGTQQSAVNTGQSTQSQLAQIEQRLVQEAQSLRIEQQQLHTLRSMEQELSRLRAWQQRLGATGTAQRSLPLAGYVAPFPMTSQHPFMPVTATALYGDPTQQLDHGHEALPQGMTLPEGWTLMPLHRSGVADTPVPTQHTTQPQIQPVTGGAPPSREQASGPTDDRGSPLFIPAVPDEHSTTPDAAQDSAGQSAPPAEPINSSQSNAEPKTPWQPEGWSFVDPPNGPTAGAATGEDHAVAVADTANGAPLDNGAESYQGKGKGKAAAVEEVPDSGA